MRVTTTRGQQFELASPAVRGDSLVGVGRGGPCTSDRRCAVALADVLRVEVPRSAVGRTAAAGGLSALLGLAALAIYVTTRWEST